MSPLFTAEASAIIHSTLEKVWEALTDPKIIKQYFFGTELSGNWEAGQTIYFRGAHDGTAYEDKGLIRNVEKHKLIQYDYRSSWDNKPDIPENYLPVSYLLTPYTDGILLTIKQGCTSAEKAADSEKNWNYIIEEMRKLIEQS
jgi:uncharacterized protein YndB with AHSA1/START domain